SFQWCADRRDLHSFPTRRSSDLEVVAGVGSRRGEADVEVEGVRVAAGRERAERDRAEAAEGTVVDRGAAVDILVHLQVQLARKRDRKSTRLNSSHLVISYAVFCL